MPSTPFFLSLVFFGTLCFPGLSPAQTPELNTGKAWVLDFSYAVQAPGADLSDRFGHHFSLGSSIHWLSSENNWLLGLQGQFLFGSEVREDVLAPLRTAEGYLIGNDRLPADILLRERGMYLGAQVGKLWPLSPLNPRSGLRLSLGGGLLQHRIRIQKDPSRIVPQLEGAYEKGYDRLSNGPAFYQFIGYQVFSKNGRINFYIGLEALQGLTQGRRDYQFDLRQPDADARLDLLWGLRGGWVLPFYLSKTRKIWY